MPTIDREMLKRIKDSDRTLTKAQVAIITAVLEQTIVLRRSKFRWFMNAILMVIAELEVSKKAKKKVEGKAKTEKTDE